MSVMVLPTVPRMALRPDENTDVRNPQNMALGVLARRDPTQDQDGEPQPSHDERRVFGMFGEDDGHARLLALDVLQDGQGAAGKCYGPAGERVLEAGEPLGQRVAIDEGERRKAEQDEKNGDDDHGI